MPGRAADATTTDDDDDDDDDFVWCLSVKSAELINREAGDVLYRHNNQSSNQSINL